MYTLLASVSVGLLATISPCVLPLYPGYLSYLNQQQNTTGNSHPHKRYVLGLAVLVGVLTTVLVLGTIISVLTLSMGRAMYYAIPLADGLILGLGILLLLDWNPFRKLPYPHLPLFSNPYLNAYVYGLLYGPIALPCSGPLIASIFAFALTAHKVQTQFSIFLWFGMGLGLPLLALSFFSGTAQRRLTRQSAIHARLVNITGGLLLIGIAVYNFRVNWETIRLFLV